MAVHTFNPREPISTLGELKEYLNKLSAWVDVALTEQTQAETPIKVKTSFRGHITSIQFTELDPERYGHSSSALSASVMDLEN